MPMPDDRPSIRSSLAGSGQGSAALTFVVRLRAAPELVRGHIEGQVEHVWSGRVADFDSPDALVSFMAQVLDASRDPLPNGMAVASGVARGAGAPTQHSAAVLRSHYKLTPAEVRLAVALAEGRSLKEAAGGLGIRITTARAHLRQVFAKTGTSRQAALVRLVLTIS
jgi:DNA-binding CsgD family transcriptional regulator